MDLYPATPGHVLVLPKQHIEDVYSMPNDIGARIMTMAIAVAKAIKEQLRPTGLKLIQANGESSGQTINHFHLHLVPRYQNDAVILKFGHGMIKANMKELERIGSTIRAGLL
jgi:histidine triad (HIT) family protein